MIRIHLKYILLFVFVLVVFAQCKTSKDMQQFQRTVFIDSVPPKLDPKKLRNIYMTQGPVELRLDTLLTISKLISKFPPNDTTAILNYYIGSIYYDTEDYKKADSFIREAVSIDSTNYRFYDLYGLTLIQLASDKKGKQADDLYNEALEKYQKALTINPNSYRIKEDIGDWYMLMNQRSEQNNVVYLEEAANYYEAASENNESNSYFKWTTALVYLAKEKETEERDSLYHKAANTLSKAVNLSYKRSYLTYNEGGNLLILGEIAPDEKKDSLYLLSSLKILDAIDLYKESFERNRITQASLNKIINECYGLLQFAYARRGVLSEGEKAAAFFDVAEMYGKKALSSGESAYNYACLQALKGNDEAAFKHLRSALKKQEIKFSFVEKDSDWNELREHPSYLELKNMYGNKKQ